MISVAGLLVTLLCCFGAAFLGGFILPAGAAGLSRLVLGFAAGSGAVSLLVLVMGILQLWSRGLFTGIVAGLAVLGAIELLRFIIRDRPAGRPEGLEWAAVLMSVALAALTLVAACAPVVDWDGLSYHLAVPKLYLEHGGFYWIPFIHHSNFPMAAEMLYAAAVALDAPAAAKIVHWVFYLAAGAGAGLLAGRLFGQRTGGWAALSTLLVPVALWEAGAAYIDLSTTAYVLLSTYALVSYFESEQDSRRWLVLAALLSGMAAATKTFALVWIALSTFWIARERWTGSERVKLPALFLSISAPLCLPWYTKSLIFTGNPVFPFLYSVLGGRGWGEAGVEMYRESWTAFGLGRGPLDFLRLPWDFLASGGAFIDGNALIGSPGPLLAMLLPLAVMRLRGRSAVLGVLTVVYVAIWFGLSQQSRYLLPVIALASTVGAAALLAEGWIRTAVRLAIAGAGACSVLIAYLVAQPALGLLLGETNSDSYIAAHVDLYWAGNYVHPEARILLMGETRGYYLHQDYMWADPSLSTAIPYSRFSTPGEMVSWMRRHNWDTILINRSFVDEQALHIRLLQEAIDGGLVEPYGGADYHHPRAQGVELWQIP